MYQICDITQPATNTISVKVQPVQQQSNQVDCGVFSIAFAVILALGDNPALVTYEQTSLRFHLNKCLKLRKLSPYPVINEKRQKKKLRKLQSLRMFTAPAREHIFKKTLKKVLIILWHHNVFIKICILKSA